MKYEKELKELENKKKEERLNWYKNIGSETPRKQKYEINKYYHNFLIHEKQQKIIDEHKIDEIKKKAKKMNDYAKMAKEMHWPSISPKK